MKRLVITFAAAALALTGCGAAQATPAPAKTITATPAAATIQEDDPAWDCATMGNRICGANPLERTEAWGAFRTVDLPEETLRQAFKVTYRGLSTEGVDFPPSQYVTLKSQLTPGKVHVFEIQPTP